MYRIAVFLYPDGEVQISLQSSEKNGPSTNALTFFSKAQPEIQKFKQGVTRIFIKESGREEGKVRNGK